MAEVVITVSRSCKRGDSDLNWSGRFDARFGERLLLERSRTPFWDSARLLLREGLARPDDRLVMRHVGSPHDALRVRVSVSAGLSVAEETGDGKAPFHQVEAASLQAGKHSAVCGGW